MKGKIKATFTLSSKKCNWLGLCSFYLSHIAIYQHAKILSTRRLKQTEGVL